MKKLSAIPSVLLIFVLSFPAARAAAQVNQRGTVDRITVHGQSLVGNLLGDSPDRHVTIYLPPSYNMDADRRYPVVYMLHGFTDSDDKWFGGTKDAWMNMEQIADRAMTDGGAREMILVVPNAFNAFHGAFYSSSVTTGDWEDFIAHDLVDYIDQHYRTIARPASRGLAGHSMGGYGALRIGIRHSDIFSSVYALSPCCIMFDKDFHPGSDPRGAAALAGIHSKAEAEKSGFNGLIVLAMAAAWSPDPKNPPLYLDLPATETGAARPEVLAEWAANMPIVTLPQHIPELKRLHALAFDDGTHDQFKSIPASLMVLDRDLNNYGIAHTYEMYDGTHTSRIGDRMEHNVLPFFSKNLSFNP